MYKGESQIPLDEELKKSLLKLARKAIEFYLKEEKVLQKGKDYQPLFNEKRGAFVSLHNGKMLRGCIGMILPQFPLDETVVRMAIAAATEDPRFKSVSLSELNDINMEISALSVPVRVKSFDEIAVGRDGLIITRGYNKGVLLPQVAEEYGWDRDTFLTETCHKAYLSGDAWKEKETIIERFSAEVFSEKSP